MSTWCATGLPHAMNCHNITLLLIASNSRMCTADLTVWLVQGLLFFSVG